MKTKSDFATKEQLDTFNEIMNRMTYEPINFSHPNSVFYFVDGSIWMEQILNNNTFYIRYKDFWEVFESKFNLNYQEISKLLSLLIGKNLHFNITTKLEYVKF